MIPNMAELQRLYSGEPPQRPGQSLAQVLGELRGAVSEGRPIIRTLATGWDLLDTNAGGLIAGEFLGIVGGPGCGKSTLADGLVVGALRHNTEATGLVVALETHPLVRVARLAAAESVEIDDRNALSGAIPVGPMLRGELRGSGTARALAAIDSLAAEFGERLRFVADVSAASEVGRIITSERPAVVEVDHLGLLVSDSGADSEVSRFDESLGHIMGALRDSGSAGILINEVSKGALKSGAIDMVASRGSARFASLASLYVGLRRVKAEPPATEPEVTAALCKSRFGPNDKQQRARFFGGFSYFAWGPVEDIDDGHNKGGKADD